MTRCYQCGDEIVRDRFGKWSHTHGRPTNGHGAAPTNPRPRVYAVGDVGSAALHECLTSTYRPTDVEAHR